MGVKDALNIMNAREIDQFKYVRSIAKGGWSVVDLYHLKSSYYAVKKYHKKQDGVSKMVEREKAAGFRLRHKNIVEYFTHFEDKNYHYLIFENVEGISLLDYLKQHTLSEADAKFVFKQIFAAVQHCHKHGVIHFDIKLENVLIKPSTKQIKLIDFGLCGFESSDNQGVFCRRTGSSEYWPIEMKRQELLPFLGRKIDVYSLGIVLYALLNGSLPFDNRKRSNSEADSLPLVFLREISSAAQDIIVKMLAEDPDDRISLDQISSHEWIKETSSSWWNKIIKM